MALSEQTLDHLLEAESHLRAAVRSSAMNEKPLVVTQLSQLLMDVARKIGSGSYTNNLSGFTYGIISCKSSNAWNGQQLQWMDSPNTTQAVTYKLSTKAADNSTVYLNDNGSNTGSFISLMEIKQ